MAATMHVTVTNGVRLPGYALPPPPLIPPTAGIFSDVFLNKTENDEKKSEEEEEENEMVIEPIWRLRSAYIATFPYF